MRLLFTPDAPEKGRKHGMHGRPRVLPDVQSAAFFRPCGRKSAQYRVAAGANGALGNIDIVPDERLRGQKMKGCAVVPKIVLPGSRFKFINITDNPFDLQSLIAEA